VDIGRASGIFWVGLSRRRAGSAKLEDPAAEGRRMSLKNVIRKRRRLRPPKKRRRRSPGEVPGTLTHDPEAPKAVVRLLAYGPDAFVEREIKDPNEIREFLGRWPVLWVDVNGAGDAETIGRIGDLFAVHRLAQEDVVNLGQRTKLEEYEGHLFLVAYILDYSDHLTSEQFSLFTGQDFVLTFQEKAGDNLEAVRERIRNKRGRIRDAAADFLAYALLDCLIDHYFPVLEIFNERLERIEEDILIGENREILARLHEIRRELRILKRMMLQLRDATERFMSGARARVTESTRLYLRDCHDHTIRAIDLVESFTELAVDLSALHFQKMSHQMNEVMRLLTLIATIFIPLTFITGIYGMNFNVEASPLNMPELNWYLGYPFALFLMLGVVGGLLFYFKRRGWWQ
jgi:magnesium transporter